MTNIFKDSRRDLRERAFQTLFALEFGGEALEQAHFAYTYDKPIDEETEVDVPAFLLSLVTGVREELAQLDSQIEEKLKEGWSLSRLIVTDRTLLRLGLYEITSFEETPGHFHMTISYRTSQLPGLDGVDGNRTRVQRPIPCTSTSVVYILTFPPAVPYRHGTAFSSFIIRPYAQSLAYVVSYIVDA